MRLSTDQAIHFPNVEDFREQFWPNNYLVRLTRFGVPFLVNASCEQDAVDYVADYCHEGMPGLASHPSSEDERLEWEERGWMQAGNESVFITTDHVRIETL